jgi:mono/diheme cytochrome c family protein
VTIVLGSAVARLGLAAQDQSRELTVSRREYDMRPLLTPSQLSATALKGRTLWMQRCAFCHDGVGQPTYRTLGPWLDSDTVLLMGDARVREKIVTGSGRMPGFQYTLRPEQVDQLLAFLKSVTPDQKPTPDQLAKVPPR